MKAIPESWRWPLALLLAPLAVLATQTNSLFTPTEKLDPWLYLAYFRHLVDYKRNLFPGTYYGSRLPLLLPGAALHSIFGTVLAGALLHLLVHAVATLSVYYAALAAAGRRAAFLTALLFSGHPWVWFAVGWDNPDGVAMAYLALALALAARASVARRPAWLLAGAGAAAAAAFYTNLFLALFIAFTPFWYAAHVAGWSAREWLRALLRAALWMALGAVVVSALLAAVNYRIDGGWNFYAPSIQFAREHHAASSNPETAWRERGLVPWLWFAVAAAAAVVLPLPRRWREARAGRPAGLVFGLTQLACLGAMAYLQATGPTVLGLYYYASYLLPLTFLALAVSCWPAVDALPAPQFRAIAWGLVLATLVLWFDREGGLLPLWPAGRYPMAAAVAGLLAFGVWGARRGLVATVASLAGLTLLTAEVRGRVPADPYAWQRDYAIVGDAMARLDRARADHSIRFWQDAAGAEDGGYTVLASLYLNGYSLLGSRVPDDACAWKPYPGDLVVLQTRNPSAVAVARDALAGCWRTLGLVPIAVDTLDMRLSLAPFLATVFRADPDPARWRPLRPAADGAVELASAGAVPLPPERWKVWVHPNDRGALAPHPAGVHATTTLRGDYSFTYGPIRVPVDGRYRFTLRYTPIEGTVAFGTYRPADAAWRAMDSSPRPLGNDRILSVLMDLKAGETADLLIAKNEPSTPNRARLILHGVEVGVLVP